MARGFESKDVEFQQAEAERRAGPAPPIDAAARERRARTATLALSLARARAELASARTPAHVRMLEAAIAALEAQMRAAEGAR